MAAVGAERAVRHAGAAADDDTRVPRPIASGSGCGADSAQLGRQTEHRAGHHAFNRNPGKYVMLPSNPRAAPGGIGGAIWGGCRSMSKPPRSIMSSGVTDVWASSPTASPPSTAREVFPTVSFLKLGMAYPLPRRLILDFARQVDTLLIVEEVDPYLEEQIRARSRSPLIRTRSGETVRVLGKDVLPAIGEFTPELVAKCAVDFGTPIAEFVSEAFASRPAGPRSAIRYPAAPTPTVPRLRPSRDLLHVAAGHVPGVRDRGRNSGQKSRGQGQGQGQQSWGKVLGLPRADRMSREPGAAQAIRAGGDQRHRVLHAGRVAAALRHGHLRLHGSQHRPRARAGEGRHQEQDRGRDRRLDLLPLGHHWAGGCDHLRRGDNDYYPRQLHHHDDRRQRQPRHGQNRGRQAGATGRAETLCRGLGIEDVVVINGFDTPGIERELVRALQSPDPSVLIVREPCVLEYKCQQRPNLMGGTGQMRLVLGLPRHRVPGAYPTGRQGRGSSLIAAPTARSATGSARTTPFCGSSGIRWCATRETSCVKRHSLIRYSLIR